MFPEENLDDKPLVFTCTYCPETFTLLGNKFRHMRDNHPEWSNTYTQVVDNVVD